MYAIAFLRTGCYAPVGWRGFKFVQIKSHALFPGEDNLRNSKNTLTNFNKILFSRTTEPISTKLGPKRSFGEGGFNVLQIRTIFSYQKRDERVFPLQIIIALSICVYWFKLVFRWAMWPMGLLLNSVSEMHPIDCCCGVPQTWGWGPEFLGYPLKHGLWACTPQHHRPKPRFGVRLWIVHFGRSLRRWVHAA